MNRIILALVVVAALCSTSFADEMSQPKEANPPAPVCSQPEDSKESMTLAGRGCCSHHKGQCGCEGGRVVCCDGSFSPSCRCEKDEELVN